MQNSAARLLIRTWRHEHITTIIYYFHWLLVSFKIVFKILFLCVVFHHHHVQVLLRAPDWLMGGLLYVLAGCSSLCETLFLLLCISFLCGGLSQNLLIWISTLLHWCCRLQLGLLVAHGFLLQLFWWSALFSRGCTSDPCHGLWTAVRNDSMCSDALIGSSKIPTARAVFKCNCFFK